MSGKNPVKWAFVLCQKKLKKSCKNILTLLKSYYIITLASRQTETKTVVTGCGSAWLERLVWDQEVAGSNPVTPIENQYSLTCGCSSMVEH